MDRELAENDPHGGTNDPPASTPPQYMEERKLTGLLDDFLLEKTGRETRRAYFRSITMFFEFSGVSTLPQLQDLGRGEVVAFRNHLKEDLGLSAAYIKRTISAISSLFKWLEADGQVSSNPTSHVKRYRVSGESRTEGLSESDVAALFKACNDGTLRGQRDKAVIVTLYYQGVRRGNASRLDMRDLRRRRRVMVLRETKTSDYKEIPLRTEVTKAIDDYLAVLNTELGISPGERDAVFVSFSRRTKGKRLSPHGIWQIVKWRGEMAGIDRKIVPHSFRHACATHALDHGAKIEEVAELLTHSQLATTQRYDTKRKGRSKAASRALPRLGD